MFLISKFFCVITITTVFTDSFGREVEGYAGVYSCHDDIISEISLIFDPLKVVNDTGTVMRCAMSCQCHDKCKVAIFMKVPPNVVRCLQFQLKIPTYLPSSVPTPDPTMFSINPLSTNEDFFYHFFTNVYQFTSTSDKTSAGPLSSPPFGQQGSTMPTALETGTFPMVTQGWFEEGQQNMYEGVSSPDFTLLLNSSFIQCKVIKFKQ